ncbi:MAG: cysteine desulfurase family protein [Bdellovibrionia bacterium]
MKNYLFFDNAATTRCCDSAATLLHRFATEDFGNPSSSHAYGQKASKAIADARQFFAQTFKVKPAQVIFTGGGTEADNLAVYGIALQAIVNANKASSQTGNPAARPRVLASAIEHPAVRKTVESLSEMGIDAQLIPVNADAQIRMDALEQLLTPETVLVSIQQVNNIVGSVLPVTEIARRCKELQPNVIFHTDAVQAFGKVEHPVSGSPVDLVSISGHKVHGPKGVGALIVLNENLLKSGIRPLIWGGEQEGGLRSGTQNAGLIAGFHAAAQETLAQKPQVEVHVKKLQSYFKEMLLARGLTHAEPTRCLLRWNSPSQAVPHIINLSLMQVAPGKSAGLLPGGLLAQMLEERGCLVSTGSACSSKKKAPDAVLMAMGLPVEACGAALRISFSSSNKLEDVDTLIAALDESLQMMRSLF